MARRRLQRGSLFKRADSWIGRWREDIIEGERVRRIKRSEVLGKFKDLSKREAQRLLDERLQDVNSLCYRPRSTITFSEFVVKWERLVLPNYKPSTRPSLKGHVKLYLRPFFGDTQLRLINPEIIQRFVASVQKGPQTVRNILNTLRSVWKAARAWGYVSGNPFEYTILPSGRRAQRAHMPVEDVRRLLAAAPEPFKTFLWVIAESGARLGEACGLRVEDIDFERRLLMVRQSAWGGKLQEPKSNHPGRCCLLSSELIAHLGEYFGRSWCDNPQGLVFSSRKGTPWNARNLLRRKLHPLLASLGLARRGFHSLRHTNSTWMDREGVPLAVRTKRLGHSDATVTLNYYTEPITEDERRMVEKLGCVLAPCGPTVLLSGAGERT